MQKILVLIIFFMDLTFISARSLSEIMSSYPTTVSMQRQKLSNVISPLGAGKSEKIQKIIHRMGSIDSNCIKNLHNQFRYNNRSVYRRPFDLLIRPLRMQAFRNDGSSQPMQISHFHKMRQDLLKETQNRRPFGNDRIIFLPSYVKLNQKRANFTQTANEYKINKTSQSDSREDLTSPNLNKITNEQEILIDEKLKKKEENTKNVETFTSAEENRKNEEPYLLGNSTVFVEMHNVSKTSSAFNDKPSETPYKLHKFKSTTTTYSRISPHHFWQRRPIPIQPYEVEEIIEEELSVDMNNKKTDNLKNSPIDGPTFPGKEIIKQKLTGSENGQKINGFHDIMGSSINSVLKSLVSPMLKMFPTVESNSETFPKEKIQNRPVHNVYFTTTSPRSETFSSRKVPDFHKITNSYRSLPNRHEQAKHLKIANPQSSERIQNWARKTAESIAGTEKVIPEMNYDSKFNITSALTVDYSKNAHATDTTEILYIPLRILKTDKNILNVKENLQQKTTATTENEISSSSESSPKLSNLSSFTTPETQRAATGFTVEQTLTLSTEIENPPESSENQTTLSKIFLCTQGLTTVKSTSIDSPSGFTEMSTEEPEAFSEVQNVKLGYDEPFSEISVNEKELTTPDFQEFTDSPMTFDLLTTVKSDLKKNQDMIGKNSRKMHFGREPFKVTTTSPITELEGSGPRRSDILITENFDEYVDEYIDNNLPNLNYLYKLKQINSFPSQNIPLNSTFIPLIPTIINDLREGKISLEDVSVLSEVLGKYWPSITVLANSTNLDMLPLLKMKNEEDWKNVLQNFLLDNTEPTTLKTEDTHPNEGNDYSPYDYLDEYKDFYEYVFDSEEKEKKRKKARTKRDEEDDLQKIEESQKYFENTEEEQIPSNGNEYENIFYIETSEEDEDASGFDMRLKTADSNINLRNVTSQTRIDIF